MTNKEQTIKLQQFITFYSNHNNIQLKNLGEVVFAIKTYLKLSVNDNEIQISCNENDISQFLKSLENIFSNYTIENNLFIE
jgi:uncharacterized protein YlbG (UPF0298 family)